MKQRHSSFVPRQRNGSCHWYCSYNNLSGQIVLPKVKISIGKFIGDKIAETIKTRHTWAMTWQLSSFSILPSCATYTPPTSSNNISVCPFSPLLQQGTNHHLATWLVSTKRPLVRVTNHKNKKMSAAEIVNKYPANFHPEIIAIREGAENRKKSREMLKGDINSLEQSKTSFSLFQYRRFVLLRNHLDGDRTAPNEKLARSVTMQSVHCCRWDIVLS